MSKVEPVDRSPTGYETLARTEIESKSVVTTDHETLVSKVQLYSCSLYSNSASAEIFLCLVVFLIAEIYDV